VKDYFSTSMTNLCKVVALCTRVCFGPVRLSPKNWKTTDQKLM